MATIVTQERKDELLHAGVGSDVRALREEFQRGRLTLYLGAGVSRDSGLPNWNTLIASLYYSAVDADWQPTDWSAYPNYLYALGEWLLRKSGEPPEVIAGKVETYYGSNSSFAERLTTTLYMPWKSGGQLLPPTPPMLRQGNALLAAVAALCEATTDGRGVHAVVTTKYDSLLEQALAGGPAAGSFTPIWKSAAKLAGGKKGIFHVHGYLPAVGDGSPYDEIMLTEAQYHGAASDPYSWSNLTLIQCFSSSTGLMIGMSMTDRNLRRLLNALSRTQLREEQYVILKEPEAPAMTACDVDEVHRMAIAYKERFEQSGVKESRKPDRELPEILRELVRQEKMMVDQSLERLGVTPLWVRDYAEVPVIIEAVAATA